MALTVLGSAVPGQSISAAQPVRITQVTLIPDTAYPAGGYAISPTSLGYTKIVDVNQSLQFNFTGAYQVIYDDFYGTVRYYQTPTTASSLMYEAVSGTNLQSQVMTCAVYGY